MITCSGTGRQWVRQLYLFTLYFCSCILFKRWLQNTVSIWIKTRRAFYLSSARIFRYLPYKQIPRARYFQKTNDDILSATEKLDRRPRSPVRFVFSIKMYSLFQPCNNISPNYSNLVIWIRDLRKQFSFGVKFQYYNN